MAVTKPGKSQSSLLSFVSSKPSIASKVECPLCLKPLDSLALALRIRHVENCVDNPVITPAEGGKAAVTDLEVKPEPLEPQSILLEEIIEHEPVAEVKNEVDTQPLVPAPEKLLPPKSAPPKLAPEPRKFQRKPRPMPFYKTIAFKETLFAVDAFLYGPIPNVSNYFLTHFHSDHYGGLSKRWTAGPVWCSPATARLTQSQLGVQPEFLRHLELNTPIEIDGVSVVFCEANHCPGAVVILFDRRIIHTGDFRASPQVLSDLLRFAQGSPISEIYLDTTYLDPKRTFPSQSSVVQTCADYIVKRQATKPSRRWFSSKLGSEPEQILVLVGTYTIGKERLAVGLANALKCQISCEARKKRILKLLGDEELDGLIGAGPDCQVRLCSMSELSFEKLFKLWHKSSKQFRSLVAFQPTGWAFRNDSAADAFTESDLAKCITEKGEIQICRVPYSEHSSFTELKRFCLNARPEKIISTVPNGNLHILKEWEFR